MATITVTTRGTVIFRAPPFVKKWRSQLGRTVDILAQPCVIEPAIIVRAWFRFFPLLVIALVKPDPLDTAFARFQKKHGRKRMFSMKIHDVLRATPEAGGHQGWYTFKLANWAQRIGWYYLVIDSTLDFVVNWTSTAYQWAGCVLPDEGMAEGTLIPTLYAGPSGTEYVIQTWNPIIEVPPFTMGNSAIHAPAGDSNFMNFALSDGEPPWPLAPAASFSARLAEFGNPTWGIDGDIGKDANGNRTVTGGFLDFLGARGTRVWEVRITKQGEGYLYLTDGFFRGVGGSGTSGMKPDP